MKPEQIATSGNVYALYSDARAKIRKRDFTAYPAARDQLEQVVKMDPNFAPAWATLSVVEMMLPPSLTRFNIDERAEQYARKAVELAPNLAAGHAALALALNFEGPVARAEIERAVRLDPNDHEALLWLGNVESREGRKKGALAAYSRAVEIEPLFWPAVLNKLSILQGLRDEAGIRELIDRERRLGAQHLVAAMQIELAREKGDLAEAANVGLEYWKTGSQDGRPAIAMTLWSLLLQLGFEEQAWKISPAPPFAPYLFKNDPKGLEMVESMNIAPLQFFSMVLLPQNASRVYVLTGRSQKLADMYLSLRLPPEQFMKLAGGGYPSLYSATMVSVALRQTGHSSEAASLLATAESIGLQQLKDGQAEGQVLLARVYAVQGRKDDALSLLTTAVNRNWLPAPPLMLTDIALDPAFAGLKGDPRFARLRQHILGTIKRERAQVRISDLN